MAIKFNCPCGKVLSSRDEDAGLKAVCPSCGRLVYVPGQIQVPDDPREQLRKQAFRFEAWVHRQQRKIMVASLLLAICIGGGLLGYKRWRTNQHDSQPRARSAVLPTRNVITLDPQADPKNWRTNFDSFAVAAKAATVKHEMLKDRFLGEKIDWVVTFDDFLQREALYFRESEPLRNSDHGILVWALVLPSQTDFVETLHSGQKIRLRGKIGPITTSRSQEHPLGYTTFRPIECKVDLVEEPSQESASVAHAPE